MGSLIALNLVTGGFTLYQQFYTMGKAAQKDRDEWLTDQLILIIAIMAIVSVSVSAVPFQGGFGWRGTKHIGSWMFDKFYNQNYKKNNPVIFPEKNDALEWRLAPEEENESNINSTFS